MCRLLAISRHPGGEGEGDMKGCCCCVHLFVCLGGGGGGGRWGGGDEGGWKAWGGGGGRRWKALGRGVEGLGREEMEGFGKGGGRLGGRRRWKALGRGGGRRLGEERLDHEESRCWRGEDGREERQEDGDKVFMHAGKSCTFQIVIRYRLLPTC